MRQRSIIRWGLFAAFAVALSSPALAHSGGRDRDNNPPGPIGGPGTNWENPPGPQGGPGTSPDRRPHRDRDNNPPGPIGGPGTNWENPPGPQGGPGTSPDRRYRYLAFQGGSTDRRTNPQPNSGTSQGQVPAWQIEQPQF